MEDHFSAENLSLILLCAYLLIILITYLRALTLDKRGIRTNAVVRAFGTEEFSAEGVDGFLEERSRDIAHIEFEDQNQQIIKAKILASRYKKEKYRNKLPIIYPKNRPQKAIIDDSLYIYQFPLGITLIGLIILLFIAGYMVFGE
ncbi:MAG: hypothetical protein KTR30_26730 [Saprospiraceae bacterium]|nr:hypothetical protein [Saprospiraceae bacterium]